MWIFFIKFVIFFLYSKKHFNIPSSHEFIHKVIWLLCLLISNFKYSLKFRGSDFMIKKIEWMMSAWILQEIGDWQATSINWQRKSNRKIKYITLGYLMKYVKIYVFLSFQSCMFVFFIIARQGYLVFLKCWIWSKLQMHFMNKKLPCKIHFLYPFLMNC